MLKLENKRGLPTLTKMLIVMVCSSIIIASVGVFTAIYYMSKPVETSTTIAIEQGQRLISSLTAERQESLYLYAMSAGKSYELESALMNSITSSVKEILDTAKTDAGVEFAAIVDTNGKIIAVAGIDMGTEIPSALMTDALNSSGMGFFVNSSGTIMSVAIFKLPNNPGLTLMLAERFETSTLVDQMKALTEMEVTIFNGDIRTATTILLNGKRILGTPVNNALISSNVLEKGNINLTNNIIANQPYACIYWPLKDFSGKIIGMGFAGLPINIVMAQYNEAIRIAVIVCIIALVGIALCSAFITSRLLAPIGLLTTFAKKVTEGQDSNLDVHRNDDLGVLADSLRYMVSTLKEKSDEANHKNELALQAKDEAQNAMTHAQEATIIAENKKEEILAAASHLEEIIDVIVSVSDSLSIQIKHSSEGAAQQAVRIVDTATALEQMNATVFEVAKNASINAGTSANTKTKALDGEKVTTDCIDGIAEVHADTLKLKNIMTTLSTHAKGINEIMAVISDIADQTNLLALNAAIEAARAGEAGRGFSVVADEVRKLAEKTMTSTAAVNEAITSIQSSANSSVEQVEITANKVEKLIELAARCGEALREIVDFADTTADGISAIATASEEQSASSEEISNTVLEIRDIAGTTAEAMTEASDAVISLSEQVHELTELIHNMKTS